MDSVTSVGFNTLRKLNSGTSQDLSIIIPPAQQSNPLSRMFTRNRSQDTLQPTSPREQEILINDNESVATFKSAKVALAKLMFRLGKFKKKKPDLNIQTSFGKDMRGQNSPVALFHTFFHRQPQNLPLPARRISEESVSGLLLQDLPTRITFSSNNSNLMVLDPIQAVNHNFINNNHLLGPDDSMKAAIELREPHHSLLLDLHRKLMVPADQYISKLKKDTHSDETVGLGISEDDYLDITAYTGSNGQFFAALARITRPIFLPSTYRLLSNGLMVPRVAFLVEEVLVLITDYFTIEDGKQQPFGCNELILRADLADERTLYQDIETYCYKMLGLLFMDMETPKQAKVNGNLVTGPVAGVMAEWGRLVQAWTVFNDCIRFYLVAMFTPLFRSMELEGIHLNMDEIIVLGFRQAAITPVINGRARLDYNRQLEGQALANYPGWIELLIRCLGVCVGGDCELLPWLMGLIHRN